VEAAGIADTHGVVTTRRADEHVPREDALAVRPARAGDADAIHSLHAGCFFDLFAGLLGDFLPPQEERRARERSWTGPIGSPHHRHALLVAERRELIVGFVAVGPTRDADRNQDTVGELRTVMVDRSERGVGVGRALVNAGERSMRAARFSIATLWVVPTNARALRCYERGGWTPDGAQRVGEVGGRKIRSVRYKKVLPTL
jgi:ribosomal protein S18 acetylase RimI-like enzyme